MSKTRKLISTMLATTMGIVIAPLSACKNKSEDELKCENEIRQLLQYDANINIDKAIVESNGFKLEKEVIGKEFLLSFVTSQYYACGRVAVKKDYDIITYSVDKDTYYYFCENYNTVETQKEVDMIIELTTMYNPVKVVEAGQEIEIEENIENNK